MIPVHLHAQDEVCFGKPALSKAPSERKHISEKVFPKKCFRTSISEQDPTPQDPSGLEVRGRYFQLVSASLLAWGRYFQLVSGTLLACCLETFSEFPKCS